MSDMLRRVVMLMAKSVTTFTYATWNPSDKAASFSLSGGNLVVTMTPTFGLIRSTIGKSSGKWYWEYVVGVTTYGPVIGIATAATSVNDYPGQTTTSWGYYGFNGLKYNNGTGTAYGSAYADGDVIGIALDMDSGTVTFYKNNVSQGTAFTGLTGTVFAAAGNSGTNEPTVTARFDAASLTYSPPAGYNAGLYA